MWTAGWKVTPRTAEKVYPTLDQLNIGMYDEKSGDMGAGSDFIGLNAFDNPADYGKHGSVTYKFTCAEEGNYYMNLGAMAGHGLANRVKATLNDVVLQENGNDYLSLSTAAGWSGDSMNRYTVHLQEGLNTLVLENSLALVNADKSAEVEEGTEGAVLR